MSRLRLSPDSVLSQSSASPDSMTSRSVKQESGSYEVSANDDASSGNDVSASPSPSNRRSSGAGLTREEKAAKRRNQNRIAAQDSCVRKKNYMKGLEQKIQQLTAHNKTLRATYDQELLLNQQLKAQAAMLSGAAVAVR